MGGTAAHWGTHTRRFLPWDFEMRSRLIERYGAGVMHYLKRPGPMV